MIQREFEHIGGTDGRIDIERERKKKRDGKRERSGSLLVQNDDKRR